tara:strand:- start:15305 stop:15598 length:294 start_codon:yes stop_codon:yes gene_type:complete
MLHTINKSPFSHQTFKTCLRFAKKDEPILLYEDGVYAAMAGAENEDFMADIQKKHTVYALQADLKGRGITKVTQGIKTIDYGGFVELVEKHKVHNWL